MKKYNVLNAISVVGVLASIVLLFVGTNRLEHDTLTIGQTLILYAIAAVCMLVSLLIQSYLDAKYRK